MGSAIANPHPLDLVKTRFQASKPGERVPHSSTYGILTKTSGSDAEQGETSATERTRSVLTYYTDFANPLKSVYSWNRSFSSSRDAFLAQNLAVYFGPGSEIEYITR